MIGAPQPRHVAEALADLARDRVLEANAYLESWRSLTQSGVPAHAIRHYLDRPAKHTPARAAVEAWKGRAGMLVLVGNRGGGKSHEGVAWLHSRHKRDPLRAEFDAAKGRWLARVPPGRWLTCSSWVGMSFDDQRAVLKLAENAPALVVDDLGAGGSTDSSDAHAKINGLLLTRFEADLPTLVCLNGTRAAAVSWLDARLIARFGVHGGIETVDGPNLRAAETDDVNHPQCPCGRPGVCGHGTAWRNNHEIVELMGCELAPRATGKHGDETVEEYWRVGLELVLGANNRRNVQASELLGLDRDAVRELAREKAANDKTPSLQAELEQALIKMAAGMSARAGTVDSIAGLAAAEHGQVLARMRKPERGVSWADQEPVMSYEDALAEHQAELAALPLAKMQERARAAAARADNEARAKTMASKTTARTAKTGDSWTRDPGPGSHPRATMRSKPPEWTQGEDGRAKLKRFGFEVKGRPGGFSVVFRDQVKLMRLPSKAAAWEEAAKLAGLGA